MSDIKKIEDEQLDSAAGGFVHRNGAGWEVIRDKTGSVMVRVQNKETAQSIAKKNKQSPREISDAQLIYLQSK